MWAATGVSRFLTVMPKHSWLPSTIAVKDPRPSGSPAPRRPLGLISLRPLSTAESTRFSTRGLPCALGRGLRPPSPARADRPSVRAAAVNRAGAYGRRADGARLDRVARLRARAATDPHRALQRLRRPRGRPGGRHGDRLRLADRAPSRLLSADRGGAHARASVARARPLL